MEKIFIIAILIVLIAISFIIVKSNFKITPAQKQVTSSIESPTKDYVVYNAPYGSIVHKGELVAEVDPTGCKYQVMQDLVNVKFEKEQYKRFKFLSKVNASAKEMFDSTEIAFGDSIEKLHEDQASLRHCYLYAPFNGKVTMIVSAAGSGVSDGGPILQITKTG
ncbi:MAG: hypothetical protein GY756_21840 [bacterium]|nr:hypothetical protein [bacterium]